MARNPSPTAELAENLQCLRLVSQRKEQSENTKVFREVLPGELTDSMWRKTDVGTEVETSDHLGSLVPRLATGDHHSATEHHKTTPRLSHNCHMTMGGPDRGSVTEYHLEEDHLSERTVTSSLEALSLSDQDHTHNIACTCECHSHREPNISCDCHVTHLDVYSTSSATSVPYSQYRTCREEAMNIYNDITVDELAGYLDELLYLPRPMSDMAELMYT